MEWKWTKGEPYERSRRRMKNVNYEEDIVADEKFSKEIETSAYSTSLNHDENTWDILNQSIYNNGFRMSNKREDLDNKIADRELVQQRGYNPFLEQNSYVNDITVSDMYLKPINTTLEREKINNNNE